MSGITFDSWYKKYEDLFTIELAHLDDAQRVRKLLQKLGTSEHEKYVNYILPKNPRDLNFDQTVSILKQMFGEQMSLFNIRYQCLKLVKSPDDDWVTYAGIVNRECENSKFCKMTDDQFKCLIFICGLQSAQDSDIRTRLLNRLEQDPDLTLQAVTTECQRLVNLKHDTAMIERRSPSEVHAVSQTVSKEVKKTDSSKKRKPPTPCWHCGEWHYARYCRFKRHQCSKCSKRGHKEECCTSQNTPSPKKRSSSRRFKTQNRSKAILSTCKVVPQVRRKYVSVSINGSRVRLQLDTASDITLISRRTWRILGKPPLMPTTQTAKSASGTPLQIVGQINCVVSLDDTTIHGTCYLTEHASLDLLGLDWIESLNLLDNPLNLVCKQTRTQAVNPATKTTKPDLKVPESLLLKHASIFTDGPGCCTKFQASLVLQPGAQAVFRPKRPVPYAALNVVEQELQRLEKLGIIEPVTYSKWAAPIVVIRKPNGTIRLCADFSTGLNAALAPYQYPLPAPEDLFAKLNGGRYFAKLDLTEAYLQIPVTTESRELLTINTHKGLYQYNRLPFGIKTAPAIFQQLMDTMLSDIPGTAAYLDDVLIMGASRDDLLSKLDVVLTRFGEYGFKLRPEKCEFAMSSIKYLGFIIDCHGRRPDPSNVAAIKAMPPPTDLKTLRAFLGLVSYYTAFLPSLHRLRAPLNHLLTKDTIWKWSTECQQSFDRIKQLLTSDLLLTHFNPELPIIVAADASNSGIGAVISHKFPDGSEKPIAHTARSLSVAERNYSQIEKEALALIFAVKKFHKMLYDAASHY